MNIAYASTRILQSGPVCSQESTQHNRPMKFDVAANNGNGCVEGTTMINPIVVIFHNKHKAVFQVPNKQPRS